MSTDDSLVISLGRFRGSMLRRADLLTPPVSVIPLGGRIGRAFSLPKYTGLLGLRLPPCVGLSGATTLLERFNLFWVALGGDVEELLCGLFTSSGL